MLYVDGVTAFLVFGGVYAAGVMQLGVMEMLGYGLVLSIVAIFGGLSAAMMDGRLGPKRTLQIAIAGTLLCIIGQLGTNAHQVLFAWHFDGTGSPLWSGPIFKTAPDLVFVCLGALSAIFVPCTYASSRTLLTRLTPPEQTGVFFGLYSLSGTATAWLAPTLVSLATNIFHNQQAGFAPIAMLLILGLIGLTFVRGGSREPSEV